MPSPKSHVGAPVHLGDDYDTYQMYGSGRPKQYYVCGIHYVRENHGFYEYRLKKDSGRKLSG